MNSKLKELLSKDYLTDVYGKIIYFVMVDGDLNSKLDAEKAIRQAVAEEMLELTNEQYERAFNRGENDPVYIELVELRQKIKEWAALKEPSK